MALIERHPPERRADRGVIVACTASCCCCCCCCLHTLGGIVGAAVASGIQARLPANPGPTERARRDSSAKATQLYWRVLLALGGLLALIGIMLAYGGVSQGPQAPDWQNIAFVIGAGFALGLPFLQVIASVVALILIAIFWDARYSDKTAAQKRIVVITGATIAGAVAGTVVMVFLLAALLNLH